MDHRQQHIEGLKPVEETDQEVTREINTTPPVEPMNTPTVNAQERVMARAVDVFMDRTEKYGEPWREAEEIDIAHMARHKVHRAYYSVRRRELGEGNSYDRDWVIESCLDGINYLAFLIRLVEEGE